MYQKISLLRGKFITAEGLDGSGKTTLLNLLAETLRSEGLDVVLTREPGGTGIGDALRAILLDSGASSVVPLAELALMFASRAQHIEQVILPALSQGKIVLCDRFTDSSEAYQGGGRQLGSGPILELHRILCRDFQPDLTVLMDCNEAVSLERAYRRNQQRRWATASACEERDESRFEQEDIAFFRRVRDKYLEIANRAPQRVVVVNARRPSETIFPEILNCVRTRLSFRACTVATNFEQR
jgi:dTMP kinase